MIRSSLFIFIAVLITSCSSKDTLVLFDKYYSNIVELDENIKSEYMSINIDKLNIDDLASYSSVLISPLLYKTNVDKFNNFSGSLYVLEYPLKIERENTFNVNISYKEVFLDMNKYIIKNKIDNVSIVIDKFNKNNSDILDIIQCDDIGVLEIIATTTYEDIDSFIESQVDSGLWIINSDIYSLYIYEHLGLEDKIIINENSFFSEKNRNIIYTIDKNLENNLNNIFRKKVSEIHSVLKKH